MQPITTATAQPTLPMPEADRHHGCGWFRSSEELAEGLLVVEHHTSDLAVQMIFGARTPVRRAERLTA